MMTQAKTARQTSNQIDQCPDNCQDAYRKFENNDLMQAGAEACRRCAESCQLMVANSAEISKV